MSTFDHAAYLKQRLATAGASKPAELLAAKAAKLENLKGFAQAPAPATPAGPDNSWVGKLGLDPDGAAGNLVNAAAEFASGATRVIGHTASAIPSMLANSAEAMLEEEDYVAYNRFVSGTATDADIARLTAQKQMPSAVGAKTGIFGPALAGPTAMELFEKSEDHRTVARNINKTMDTSSIVQQDERNKLRDALNASYRENEGSILDLASGAVDAVAENPRGTLGYVIENIPQIGMGLLGKAGKAAMATSNVGYGADTYDQGLEIYQAKNGGKLPEKETRNRMQGEAIAIAAAEQVGEMVGLAGMGKVGKAGKEAAEELRTSLLKSGKNIIKAITTGGATEAATEGYQTLLEESIKGNIASGEDIYAGAVIGGVSGAALTGGGRTLAEVAKATPEHMTERAAEAGKAEKFAKAVEDGDHTRYLDEKSKDYDPIAAVRVLYATSQKADATPESKQKNLEAATEVVTNLEQKRENLQAEYDSMTEAGLKKTEALLARTEEQLKNTDPADTARVEMLTEMAAAAKEQITEVSAAIPANKKTAAKLESQLRDLDRQLNDSRNVRDEMVAVESAKIKDSDVQADLKLAEAGDTKAASRIVSLSMTSMAKLTPEDALKLANNKSLQLKPEERDYLRSFNEARQTENRLRTMKKVSQEILTGEQKAGGNIGIAQYRTRVAAALASNNQAGAQYHLGLLDSFRQDHAQKAEVAKQAYDQSLQDGKVRQVLRGPAGWKMTTDLVDEKKRVANGGLEIHPIKSKNLVPSMQVEAQALSNAYTELTNATTLRFGKGAVQSNPSPAAPQAQTPATPASPSVTPRTEAPGKNNLPQKNVEKQARPSQSSGETVAPQPQKAEQKENISPAAGLKKVMAEQTKAAADRLFDFPELTEAEQVKHLADTLQVEPETATKLLANLVAADPFYKSTKGSSSPPSPAVTASAPIAVAGAPAQGSAAPSAPAAGEKETTTEPEAAAGQATEPANDTSAASVEQQEQAAPAGLRLFNQYKKLTGKLQEIWNAEGFNPLAQFLKQDLNSERYKTERPLVAISSFLASWKADPMLPLRFLENGDALLEKTDENQRQLRALNDLETHLEAWVPIVDTLLMEHGGSAKFLSEDLMQYLIERTEDGKLTLDENIKVAIAYSGYSWVLSQANAPAWKTDSEIAKMHGRGKEAKITEEGRKALRHLAGFEDRVIHELGDLAVQALGIVNDPNAPGDLLPRLKMALGTHALTLLADPKVNLAKRAAQKNSTVQSYFITEGDKDTEGELDTETLENTYEGFNAYVRLNREGDNRTLTPAGQQIRDANKESRGVVDRLFGADKAPRIAGTTPVKFRQKYAKGTQQEVTEEHAATIQESMDDPFRPVPEMMDVFIGLRRENILYVAGHEDLETVLVHDRNKDAIEAQNMNLENQFDLGMEGLELDPHDLASRLTEATLTTPRYIEQSVWKNFRAGFMNASLNPQTSKIHRALFARAGWTATISMADDAMKSEFKVAVAMGLGVKTDQQRNSKTLDTAFEKGFEAELKKPGVSEAIDVLRRAVVLKQVTAWTPETRALVAQVAREREGMQTLQAMTMYAKFLEAEKVGDASVDVTLLVGVDGKTNGPMLSHLALGAAEDLDGFYLLLNRGGFFSTDEGQADHFSQWYEGDGNQDLYEDLGARIVARVAALVKPAQYLKDLAAAAKNTDDRKERGKMWAEYFRHFTLDDLKAIELVTKELVDKTTARATKEMRKLTKVPLTSFAFGSSLKKSIANMQASFIDSYYAKLEELAGSGASVQDVAKYIGAMNALVRMGNSKDNKAEPISIRPAADMLKLKLTAAQEKSLHAAFKRVIGNSVEEEMKEYFDTFIARRKQLNNTIQASYQAFESAYAAAKMAEMERLMDTGEVAYRISKRKVEGKDIEVRVPWHDLSPNQEKKVRDSLGGLTPVMHSHYSIKANDLKSGLYMAKTKVTVSDSPLYTSKVYVNRDIPRMIKNKKTGEYEKENYPHLVSHAQTRVEQSPGVAGAAYSIHSSDSSVMHQMLAKVKGSLNVHDEGGNGVHKVRDVARELNAATAETFLEYSPAREAALMLTRAITGMAKQVREGKLPPSAVVRMVRAWEDNYNMFLPAEYRITAEEAAEATLKDAIENAYRADYMRLTALAKLKSVDQYVWEGGQFVADDKFRARAQKKLEGLTLEASPGTKADLAFLIEQFQAHRAAPLQPAAWVDIKAEERADKDTRKQVVETVADLGKSRVKHDDTLVALLVKTPTMTAKEMVKHLRALVASDDFRSKLLGQMERVMGDVTVQYVTAATPKSSIPVGPSSINARGWYDPENRIIYVLSPDYRYSGVTAELVMHEMLHAGLVDIVHAELDKSAADPKYKSDALALIDDLEALRLAAHDFLQENDLMRFAPAVENVDELIAYGMTNPGMQSVLGKMTFTSKTGANRLVSAMREFIDLITGLFFGRRNDTMARGMDALIQNVGGLFEAAAEQGSVAPTSRRQAADMATLGAAPATAEAIFDALGTSFPAAAPGFQAHLRGLLGGIVEQLHGPFGVFKDLIATTQATDPTDIWLEAKALKQVPFASRALALPMTFTEQEAFVLEQVEATVRAAISGNEGMTTLAYRELAKLHSEAAKKLSRQDFINAGLNPDLYDFVFEIRTGADGRSDYLSRFAALGLASQQFSSLLGFATASTIGQRNTSTLVERLHKIFDQILEFFTGRITQTFAGQDADEKLEQLVNILVKIEVKKRHKLGQQKSMVLGHVEDVFRKGTELARGKVEKLGRSALFQNSRSGVVQATGQAISLVAGDRVEQLLETMNTFRDQHFHKRHGITAGLVNEVRGANETNLESHVLIRESKNNERRRKEADDYTARYVLESFIDAGANLTKEQKAAVTQTFLRADVQALLDHGYDLNDILRLISVPAALDREIAALEKMLAPSQFAQFYVNAADALGYHLSGGPVKSRRLLLNAGNIARGFTTSFQARITQAQAQQYEPVIDQLATLFALRHTDGDMLKEAATVLKAELARNDKGNGVEMILKLHKDLQKQSKDRLFRDSEALMMKGYTPEIYDPYMDVRVATEQEGQALLDQGYSQGLEVAIDPNDPDQEPKFIYHLRDGGLERYLTGIMAYDGMTARGSRKHDGNTTLVSAHGMQNASTMAQINAAKQNDERDMLRRRIDMRTEKKIKDTFLAPVVNPAGQVVNWRYLMTGETKNVLLSRDNRFEQVLGRMAGSILSKESTGKHNRTAVEALKAQYDAEFATKAPSYIRISPVSQDPDMRQIWNMLPESTKQAVREVWGREEMLVRIDLLDITFGYRKLTLSRAFEKDAGERTMMETWFVDFWTHFLGTKAALRVRQGEDIWETIVREAKDIIVVKSGITLLGNQLSNMSLLLAYGVGPREMLHHFRISMQGAMAHRRDSAELFRLQRALETGYTQGGNVAEMKARAAKLQDALARNPVRQMIEAGLMPTIVEDVAGDDDLYSFKSQLTKSIEDRLSQFNPNVLKVAKMAYMTHDTRLYRALAYGTQMSDFMARYTLYQHLTTKKNPMDEKKAVQAASDAFINYDVPSHRILQKMNDAGLVWFTKYYLRVQKVIMHLYRENPGRALALLAFNNYFDWVPTVLDSAVMNRIGNPFGIGALAAPGLLDDTLVMRAAAVPFK